MESYSISGQIIEIRLFCKRFMAYAKNISRRNLDCQSAPFYWQLHVYDVKIFESIYLLYINSNQTLLKDFSLKKTDVSRGKFF